MDNLERITLPYKIKSTNKFNNYLTPYEKEKRINNILKFSRNKTINSIIEYYSYYLNNISSEFENSILERIEILSKFKNERLVELYKYEDNLRLLKIISRITNEDVYQEVLKASKEKVLTPNLEIIAMQKTKGMAMLKLARLQVNAEDEFKQAYDYGEFNNIEICHELDKIGKPVDQSILVIRAITLSTQLGLKPWMIRNALPVNGYGKATANFYEGIDLGECNNRYMTDNEYQKLLTRAKSKPFSYVKTRKKSNRLFF